MLSWIKDDVPALVRGDPGRFRQVLINLLGNAVKFTERGEAVLRVRAEQGSGQKTIVRFEISDTGVGIPLKARGQLFRSFSQVEGIARRYGGTGLGLAISKQLVELMGGEIGVESESGRGSTFWFTVPLARQAAPMCTGIRAPKDVEGLRVLIAGENAANRLAIHAQLAAWGFDVGEAATGPEAFRMLAAPEEPFNAALIDLRMPGIDIADLARRVRADASLAGIRLIALVSLEIGRAHV